YTSFTVNSGAETKVFLQIKRQTRQCKHRFGNILRFNFITAQGRHLLLRNCRSVYFVAGGCYAFVGQALLVLPRPVLPQKSTYISYAKIVHCSSFEMYPFIISQLLYCNNLPSS